MTSYQLDAYQFDLPDDLIAQHPAPNREDARLLVARHGHETQHTHFRHIGDFLQPGDTLVLNQTRVMKARCLAQKETGGQVEVFILNIQVAPDQVPVMLRPAKRVKPDTVLTFPKAGVKARVVSRGDMGRGELAFDNSEALHAVLEQDGALPLPPYIKRNEGPSMEDEQRYQTVYARDMGAVAAPTAGLHFTQALLGELERAGIHLRRVTHHVGIGTFKPITADDIREHQMEVESYIVDEDTAAHLNQAKADGRRIIAVGTTSTRCLESNYNNGFHAGAADTNHYIYPPYRFRAIDGLITNFHLPGSSLMLLVSALMGRDRIMALYRDAVTRRYRFYSYGDAMLLIP